MRCFKITVIDKLRNLLIKINRCGIFLRQIRIIIFFRGIRNFIFIFRKHKRHIVLRCFRRSFSVSRRLRHSRTRRLRLTGACDVVEFRADPAGVPLQGQPGLWLPTPVEYKHGAPKESDADRLQLCAQGMALEEMLACEVPRGALFYQETRRREAVELTLELRQKTQAMADEMNAFFARGHTPKVKPGRHCNACSLKELCLPALCRRADAAGYIRAHLEEAEGGLP